MQHEASQATPKTSFSRWNHVSICFRSGDITTSGLAAAILHFGCRSTSEGVGNDIIVSGKPENLGIAVGTACLSVVEREILLLPVWQSPSCISGVGQRRRVLMMSPSSRATAKTWVLPLEPRVYLLYIKKITTSPI